MIDPSAESAAFFSTSAITEVTAAEEEAGPSTPEAIRRALEVNQQDLEANRAQRRMLANEAGAFRAYAAVLRQRLRALRPPRPPRRPASTPGRSTST